MPVLSESLVLQALVRHLQHILLPLPSGHHLFQQALRRLTCQMLPNNPRNLLMKMKSCELITQTLCFGHLVMSQNVASKPLMLSQAFLCSAHSDTQLPLLSAFWLHSHQERMTQFSPSRSLRFSHLSYAVWNSNVVATGCP